MTDLTRMNIAKIEGKGSRLAEKLEDKGSKPSLFKGRQKTDAEKEADALIVQWHDRPRVPHVSDPASFAELTDAERREEVDREERKIAKGKIRCHKFYTKWIEKAEAFLSE